MVLFDQNWFECQFVVLVQEIVEYFWVDWCECEVDCQQVVIVVIVDQVVGMCCQIFCIGCICMCKVKGGQYFDLVGVCCGDFGIVCVIGGYLVLFEVYIRYCFIGVVWFVYGLFVQ